MGFKLTTLKKWPIYISGPVNVKAFSATQKYKERNSKAVVISCIVCRSLSFAYCVRVFVCVCLHCPQIGSDDSTMLTSQDALTPKTFTSSLPDSQAARHQTRQLQVA